MSANIETMFYVREKPWHGLGTEVKEAPTSADALVYAGLDWLVEQKNVYAEDGTPTIVVNANLKMSVFAEKECHFSPDSIQVYTALTTTSLVGLKPVKP